jgi:hypothetical protein
MASEKAHRTARADRNDCDEVRAAIGEPLLESLLQRFERAGPGGGK